MVESVDGTGNKEQTIRSDETTRYPQCGRRFSSARRRILAATLIAATVSPACTLQQDREQSVNKQASRPGAASRGKGWWFPSDIRTGVEQRFEVAVSAKITNANGTRNVDERAHFSVEILPDPKGRPGCVVRLKPPDPADYAASEELAWFWILNLASENREGMRGLRSSATGCSS